MKRLLTSALALTLIAAMSGCACNCDHCSRLGSRLSGGGRMNGGGAMAGGRFGGGRFGGAEMYGGGAPSPTVAYPYYTVRDPRDCLAKNPGDIGP